MPRGFIVHGYADRRHNRILLAGRLEGGESFAAAVSGRRPSLLVAASDLDRVLSLGGFPSCEREASPLAAFDSSSPLVLLRFSSLEDHGRAATAIRNASIPSPDADMKPADALLMELGIRGPVEITGVSRKGRSVDLVFPGADLRPADSAFRAPLRLSSIDIETDERTREIRAVSVATSDGGAIRGLVRVVRPSGGPALGDRDAGAGQDAGPAGRIDLRYHETEADLLAAFARDIVEADCDVLTGWNVLDFDLPRLAERFAARGLPFTIGRSMEEARYLAGEGRRSAAVFVSGRQVFDALRAVRAGPVRYEDHGLETVAREVLGEGKLVSATGEDKIAELDRLYAMDPAAFGAYCLRDSELVLRILEKTGLFKLAVERAVLTGVSIDKAWTSVASFERVYGLSLRERGIAGASALSRRVSGAAGGTVLEPIGGLFRDVAVFDFRSLYPTLMLTFNIDPYAYELALRGAEHPIVAPNGAAFDRTPGALPALIEGYFAARRRALAAGDDTAAYVYKILMNSFYGVLGTPTCRYARTELAGAITSAARKWLRFSRDRFVARGLRVLYGDTDSLFVELAPLFAPSGETASPEEAAGLGARLAADINAALAEAIRSEYALESRLELRFEKLYRRFLIPPLRSAASAPAASAAFSALPSAFSGDGYADGAARGRAKGYAGLLRNADGDEVEVKGMEAVRSDSTPLARRLQMELLDRVFHDAEEAELLAYLRGEARRLETGELDGELVYRRRLVRSPESYTASTPPQVKAARALGWKGKRGIVEYVWTTAGAEPVSAQTSPIDRRHYLVAQLLPFAEALFIAAGWDAGRLRSTLLGSAEGQLDLGL